ncbi:MAG: LysR family transcriptional regulator [Rhodobacteraceae bacterium]|nr:LysR family transcriptional regulator [Paracoccaceae bacterium]
MRDIDLRTFVALARNRHFGRTARELHTTQPGVSARLSGLEAELGCRLVNRGDGGFALTAQGEAALESFERVLDEIERLRERLRRGAGQPQEPLRIGAIDTVAATWLPGLMAALHRDFPAPRVELTVEGTAQLVHSMRRGGLDLIFCLHPVLEEGIRSYPACGYEMIWAGAPGLVDPARTYRVAELAALPVVSFARGTPPFQMIAPFFYDERVHAADITTCNSLHAMISLLIAGYGVGALPTVTIAREMEQGLLHRVRIAKPFPPLPIIASYRAGAEQGAVREAVRRARAAVLDYCAASDPAQVWTGAAGDPAGAEAPG